MNSKVTRPEVLEIISGAEEVATREEVASRLGITVQSLAETEVRALTKLIDRCRNLDAKGLHDG